MKTKVININSGARFDVYVGRPSKWGNPFSHLIRTTAAFKVKNRRAAILAYKDWITKGDGRYLLKDLKELKGKTLGCCCIPLDCHAIVLAELADALEDNEMTEEDNND